METHFFRYQILRYIADLRRMEPENIGIIVQGAESTSCLFNTHLGARPNFDFDNYRRWREFFMAEIYDPTVPLFQFDRASVEFLQHLQKSCYGNYSLTNPLELIMETGDVESAQKHLFKTLVLKPNDKNTQIKQPVQCFKNELEVREILGHSAFKKGKVFKAKGLKELVTYHYLREGDVPVLVQPVQVLPDRSRTVNEMERAEALVNSIRKSKVSADISVVVDEVPVPTDSDDETKKWAFDKIQQGKTELRRLDVNIIDSKPSAVRLAAGIETDLQNIERNPQAQMAFA